MRILFISYNGALEPLMQSQGIPYLKGLTNKGVKCILLTFEKLGIENKNILKKKIAETKNELKLHNIEWHHLRYHKRPSVPATLFDMVTGILVGVYIIISQRVDIVHARATIAATIAYIAAKTTGKKFVFDVRGLMAEEYVDGGIWKRNGILYFITCSIERKLLNCADALVVLTENIKEVLINDDYFEGNLNERKRDVTVIPCCVDLNRFTISGTSAERLRSEYKLFDKFIFLYAGSIGTWYMLNEMINFFIAAKTLINNAHFLVLTHVEKEAVQMAWRKRGLHPEDITTQSIEFKNIPHYIKLASVGIFFIKPAFSKRSSCPIKFAEYLACSLPVVINAGIGDTDKIVEKYKLGVVINEFNREAYLSSTSRLLELMKDTESLRERCRKVAAEEFSLDIGVARYFNIYRRLKCH